MNDIKVIAIDEKPYDMEGNSGINFEIVIEFHGIPFNIVTSARKQGLSGIMVEWQKDLQRKGGN